MKIATESIILKSDGSDMGVYIARPEAKKAPGLIVFQEAFGVNDHIKDVARRFAEQGYVAVAPELFHRTAPPGFTGTYGDFASVAPHFQAVTTDAIASDARAVFDWLSKDSQVGTSHIGSIGFCMGGRCSFIANAKLPLQAAVSFYGGGIVPALLDLAQEQSGPILFFWGGLDQHIDPEQRNGIADAMTKAGKPYINVEISDANHAFFCDARPSYNAIAAKHAWALTLSFLETHLKS
jgi:carboxymethylenebutenolidase